MEKKSERLEVRLGYQEKQAFTEACDMQGDTPSGAIRRFINGYVRRSDSDVLASVWRGSAKRKFVPAIAAVAVCALFAAGIYGITNLSPQASADEIFSFRDANNDGELDYSEHAVPPGPDGAPNGVLRVLDIDASGTISRAEFVREGRMVYVAEDDPAQESYPQHEKTATLVEFKFTRKHAETSTFFGAVINAKKMDRLVIWPSEGLPIVMEGDVAIAMGQESTELQSNQVTDYSQKNQRVSRRITSGNFW